MESEVAKSSDGENNELYALTLNEVSFNEEHINHLYWMSLDWPEDNPSQLDLLYPIKFKKSDK